VARDRPFAVDRLAERIDHATEQPVADRHFGDAAGAPDLVAFLDLFEAAEDRRADVVLFEVQHQAVDLVRELDELAGGGLVEAIDAGDAVAGREHPSRLAHLHLALVLLNLALDDVADLGGADLHSSTPLENVRSFAKPGGRSEPWGRQPRPARAVVYRSA